VPSAASKAVVKSVWEDAHNQIRKRNWEVFDFVGLEKRVANKLTDDDVGDILVCIDAVNKVKRLKKPYRARVRAIARFNSAGADRFKPCQEA